jgi:mRNA-degrading endonuclease RelE of RelBE toxin-antitoxin system
LGVAIDIRYALAFTKAINKLSRKYHTVVDDALPVIEQIRSGETPGDRVQEVSPHIVYKVRAKNTGARRGKSGGFRMIYYVKTAESITMLTIYSKTERVDITVQQILDIIESLED